MLKQKQLLNFHNIIKILNTFRTFYSIIYYLIPIILIHHCIYDQVFFNRETNMTKLFMYIKFCRDY